jgi:cell division protein FtsQ
MGAEQVKRNQKKGNRPVVDEATMHRRMRWLAALLAAVALIGTGVWGSAKLLNPNTLPIRSIQIEGGFRHLSAKNLQRVVAPHVSGGFFTIDIQSVQNALLKRPWVDSVSVRRVWPDTLRIRVTEHVPFARWGKDGFVDAHGNWFAAPQEASAMKLPEFVGPKGFQSMLTKRYQEINRALEPIGRRVSELHVTDRRAWQLVLDNGLVLRLGRQDIDTRLRRFVRAYPTVVAQRLDQMAGVDLRYTNGFAVRWRPQEQFGESRGG